MTIYFVTGVYRIDGDRFIRRFEEIITGIPVADNKELYGLRLRIKEILREQHRQTICDIEIHAINKL